MPKQSKKLPIAGEDGVGLIATSHKACTHYPCQQLYSMPFDEAKFRAALVGVAAEDGIEEDEVDVKFVEEKPNDWPSSGSYDATSALINSYPKGTSYMRDLFVRHLVHAGPLHAGWKRKIVADLYIMDRCLFMNNYGKRTMPTPFHTCARAPCPCRPAYPASPCPRLPCIPLPPPSLHPPRFTSLSHT